MRNNQRFLKYALAAFALTFMSFTAVAQEEHLPEPKFDEIDVEVNTVKIAETDSGALNEVVAGLASFYANKFNGRRTANGETFNQKLLTAAHLILPFGTQIKVTNPKNSKSVIVRVNDRGPCVRGRLLDLSRAAANLIGITRLGVARIELEILKPENFKP